MADQEARYDRIAEAYAAWWAPVHRPATLGLLDLVGREVAVGAQSVLDVGAGTGVLAAAIAARWPGVRVTAVDASARMLDLAAAERDRVAPAALLELRQAQADALPFDDGSFDLVVSSFVLQLVPSRIRALREARRVMRPGGRLAYVTWLEGGEPFAGDRVFDEALDALEIEVPDGDDRSGDVVSPGAAVAQLRRAGFVEASARPDTLAHHFTPSGYLRFLTEFDAAEVFESVGAGTARRLRRELASRLAALPEDALRLVLPIVRVTGRRPIDGRRRGRA